MKTPSVKDSPGKLPIADMRTWFEKMIRTTPQLRDAILLTVEHNGSFHHYANPDTDWLWVGFAIGMRMSERVFNSYSRHKS